MNCVEKNRFKTVKHDGKQQLNCLLFAKIQKGVQSMC